MRISHFGIFLLMTSGMVFAQTTIPSLDQSGRKGDMARLAQERAAEKFEAADADKDEKLSKAEVEKVFPYIFENFARYDKNADGVLTWEEYVGHGRWKRAKTP